MATARMLSRQLFSIATAKHPRPCVSILKGFGFACHGRLLQTKTEAKDDVNSEHQNSGEPSQLTHSNQSDDLSGVSYKAMSSLKTSPRHDLAMVFTCKVCETRSVRTVCRQSYEKGVVVVRCGGCNNSHLIADHLGLFGAPGSVEDFLAARGEQVKRGSVDTLSLTLDDLVGSNSSSSSVKKC
ncbi:hypothetical protein Syun_000874 [Stephania yunnanensis]|uniref:DNL-type domain-containing protein n=1 Tax=Stephania yunnanensis TaxID=152371 RepID=A0AAP0LGS7_9MAGN